MQLHLNEISTQLPENTHAAIIMDGAKWHDTPKLIVPENITVVLFTADPVAAKTHILSLEIFEKNTVHTQDIFADV